MRKFGNEEYVCKFPNLLPAPALNSLHPSLVEFVSSSRLLISLDLRMRPLLRMKKATKLRTPTCRAQTPFMFQSQSLRYACFFQPHGVRYFAYNVQAGFNGAMNIDATCADGEFMLDNVSYYNDTKIGTELTAEADWKRRGFYLGPQVRPPCAYVTSWATLD